MFNTPGPVGTPGRQLSSLFARLTTESPFATPYQPSPQSLFAPASASATPGGSEGVGERPSNTPAGPKTKVLPRRPSKRASLIRDSLVNHMSSSTTLNPNSRESSPLRSRRSSSSYSRVSRRASGSPASSNRTPFGPIRRRSSMSPHNETPENSPPRNKRRSTGTGIRSSFGSRRSLLSTQFCSPAMNRRDSRESCSARRNSLSPYREHSPSGETSHSNAQGSHKSSTCRRRMSPCSTSSCTTAQTLQPPQRQYPLLNTAKKKEVRQNFAYESLASSIAKQGVQVVALDWDCTMVSCHTRGQWYGSAADLVTSIRPMMKKFVIACIEKGLLICIVTFSGQKALIEETLALTFPYFRSHPCIVKSGSGEVCKDEVTNSFPHCASSNLGKLPHLLGILKEVNHRTFTSKNSIKGMVLRSGTVLFSDNVDNNHTTSTPQAWAEDEDKKTDANKENVLQPAFNVQANAIQSFCAASPPLGMTCTLSSERVSPRRVLSLSLSEGEQPQCSSSPVGHTVVPTTPSSPGCFEVQPMHVLLIDDDEENIRIAAAGGFQTSRFLAESPELSFEQLAQMYLKGVS
mmetsp:Transcript_11322/g.21536  ORF Transcript_11322/g.21536 Transcript_11322/m.21536 type:complete len:575 (-) Transcript_11322:183-1907(-)